jgi:hypothetical protein
MLAYAMGSNRLGYPREPPKEQLNSKGTDVGSGPLSSDQPDLTQVYSDSNKKENAASYPAWWPFQKVRNLDG